MRPPAELKPYVRKFCRLISPHEPIYVPLIPLPDKPLNECFTIVPEHIAAHGGRQSMGWTIWEWPGVFIEAEFHCVWERPTGELVDLTPKPQVFDAILFLPDPEGTYEGRQVDNIRRPLIRTREVSKLIELHEQVFEELNRGDLADKHGYVEVGENFLKLQKRIARLQESLTKKHGPP